MTNSTWTCLPDTLGIAAFRLNDNNDVACGSIDGVHCAWVDRMPECDRRPTRELSCGAQYKSLYGVSGYDVPGGWCARVRSILQLNGTTIVPSTIPQETTTAPVPNITTPNTTVVVPTAIPATVSPTPTLTDATTSSSDEINTGLYIGIGLVAVAIIVVATCLLARRRRRENPLLKSAHNFKSSPLNVAGVTILTNNGLVHEEADDEVYDRSLHDTNATLTLTSLRSSFQQDLGAITPYQLLPHKLHLLHAEADPTQTAAVNMVGIESYQALYDGNRVVVQKRQLSANVDVQTRVGHLLLRVKLTSAYLVTMHGVLWTKPTELQLVFECMDRGRLKDYLTIANDDEALVTKLDYAVRIVEGLLYIHAKGVTHRNISSSSVYLNARGEAKLCDFGWLREEDDFVDVYSTQRAAPEILSGLQYTVQADIFALGALLKEMAVFKGASTAGVRRSSAAGESLANVVKSCMNWNPTYRPSLLHVRRALRNELHRLQT
ncbi:serine/threonine protein kinase [Saprolegnia diclina VS20]|uniref:Serine/threonine protein kinase n=1 Tax=Saprolegnia diclina (strain VS20) TaxID=1156394 RepID=T0PZI7_SAPDV|nr:serine/threonine protein kinase [Saprolegnia diclina VS20]XP_008618944.1 serine/threonine protein kinase [Saprolegnia diclina VS20]EQC27676.1 serine/threonine protein kinase [Saprolegnia diclina VS20]EQC28287.1 serine/threonine protein kinase [Saprolegnia diclina VS20]|eukprot:XP_008618291.1 serine/threonine protein kinase [Saprolegnia diclina VS20]